MVECGRELLTGFAVGCVLLLCAPTQRFRDGYVMVGFSLGYLVVISTHLDEIGRERFCARFHRDALRDIAYCPRKHKVATAGENQIKIVDMKDWKEVWNEDIETNTPPAAASAAAAASTAAGAASAASSSKNNSSNASSSSSSSSGSGGGHGSASVGPLDKLVWTPDGEFISVSTRHGCLYIYAVDRPGGIGSTNGHGSAGANGAAGDAASRAAARRREHEHGDSIFERAIFKPFTATSLLTCTALLAVTGILALSNAAGLSLMDMWRLTAYTWSV